MKTKYKIVKFVDGAGMVGYYACYKKHLFWHHLSCAGNDRFGTRELALSEIADAQLADSLEEADRLRKKVKIVETEFIK